MRVILITSGAVLFITCATFFTYEFISSRQATLRQLSTVASVVATNSTAAIAFQSKDEAAEILSALHAEKNIVAAGLYDTTGQLFAKYPDTLSSQSLPQQITSTGFGFYNGYLQGFQPVVQGNTRLGTLYIKSNLNAVKERFMLYGFIAFLVILASAVIGYLLSKRLQRSISVPILQLAETAQIISNQQDYSIRAKQLGHDEIGTLTKAFNQMLTRIEHQNEEITTLNYNLEQKVEQRTRELAEANNILKQQNEFVETIIDNSVHVLTVFDAEMRFTVVNKKCEELYSIKREDVIGKTYIEVFPSAKSSSAYQDILKALQGHYVHNEVTRSTIIDGFFENYFIPLQQHNRVYGVLVLSHDVTALMKSNEKLQAVNSELEKSNRDLEQFAYVASHDLQEPLRKIQTFAELAEKNFHNPVIAHRYFEKISSSARRMSELIKAVLKYSLLSKPDETEPVNLNQVIENVKSDLELMISEKGAEVKAAPLPNVDGVPLQLHQLFYNLVANALKFSASRPQVQISYKQVSKNVLQNFEGEKPYAQYAQITVADNGIGFKQQYADKIFDIFQRLHTSPHYTGTGIGLALCKKIVGNHQGFISVNSEDGVGTTFYIYLPISLSHRTVNTSTAAHPI